MATRRQNRRQFLAQSSVAALASASMPFWGASISARAAGFVNANDRPLVGCIGTGDRWRGGIVQGLMDHGDIVAVCDVDGDHVGKGRDLVRDAQGKKGVNRDVDACEDYRKVLERGDIDVVSIVTPDHWHSKIAIEAMKAGKDIYCEKPLTLTIEEGKQIIKVLNETRRVFQVGTQQRSEMGSKEIPQFFLYAVALAHSGRLGKITKVTCAIGGAPSSGPLPKADPPKHLNWEMWLGQAPLVDYVSGPVPKDGYPQSRCHYEFRWWYEYSGGKMTDWGAHHVDIGQWALQMDHSGPVSVEGTAEHPCPMHDGHPTLDDRYNAATRFHITCRFANGAELIIVDSHPDFDNGVLIEGTEGRIFANRGKLTGRPVEELKSNPLPEEAILKLCKGKRPGNHMRNFFECVASRDLPISDVYTHHRAMTTCHLANIAIRLGRKINWDPQTEQIVGDSQAQQWQAREQRKGYEIVT